MSYSGSLMTLCWAESLVAQTLALKFKITEASWKRKQMKFSRDNSIKGLQCRRRNINREVVLKQSRMQYLIREVHVKCQGSSVEKNYISPWFKSCYVKSFQLCLTLCNPMDCSPPGSSVHGIFQARILEGVARPSSRGSSPPTDWAWVSCVSCIAGGFFTTELLEKAPDSSQGCSKCCVTGGAHILVFVCGATSVFHRKYAVFCFKEQENFYYGSWSINSILQGNIFNYDIVICKWQETSLRVI